MSRWLKIVYGCALALTLAGCSGLVWPDQVVTQTTDEALLEANTRVGQTFLSREAGLQAVEIFLTPLTSGEGEIRLHLRAEASASVDLAQADLALSTITAPAFYRFTFPAQPRSRLSSYYLDLEMLGAGQVVVGHAAADSYLEGALYQNGQPVEAQMAFRLVYAPQLVLGQVAREWLGWAGYLGLAALAFVIPGVALLSFWPGANRLIWPEHLGLGIGLSLALYPVLFLWTNLVGLRLGPGYVWLPIGLSLALFIWRGWQTRALFAAKNVFTQWRQSHHLWADLALLAVVGLVFWSRFWAIRSFQVPLWGDSYHHTVIAQLLVDNQGLFSSWQPYADLQSLTYHFGFHTHVAVWHWLTGMSLPQATLWAGQVLNGLAVLALYPLAMRVGHNRWGGVLAVMMAGLFASMPMNYVNWGRYTQLAGQAILPVATCLSWHLLKTERLDWRVLALGGLTWGGLALTHYRILIFALAFLVAYLFVEVLPRHWAAFLGRVSLLGIGAGGLFLPWLWHLWDGKISLNFLRQMSTPASEASAWVQSYNAIGDLFVYLPAWMWLLLPVGVGWGLWQQRRGVVLVSVWWFLLILAANPGWLQLPGTGVLSNFAVFIAFYIPAGTLLGSMAGSLIGKIERRPLALAVMAVGLMLGAWGAYQRTGEVRLVEHALATTADQRAANWIQANIAPEATFLVNTFMAYGGGVVVGSDGGWWLPLLARRQTTLPPINYATERGPEPDYAQQVVALATAIQSTNITDPAVLTLLREHGVTHVYIGQRQGRVNNPQPALSPTTLNSSPHFRLLYRQDRVWIFEFCGGLAPCSPSMQ